MAQVNKISSFKSFTEIKNQEATMKLREENNAKRQETVGKIGAILDEMGLTSLSELDEDRKQALISKMFGNVSEDEAEDIEDEINKLGEPKKLEERNAFLGARAKAIEEDKTEFEFNGKIYKVTVNEGNAFGDAVRKAKEAGEKEFEFDGKTYKVEEGNAFGDAVRKAKEAGEKEFEFDGKTYKVEEALVFEGKHGMAKRLLQNIINGDTTEAEGIKMSKEMAEHYLYWISTSPYGTKNSNLPLYMLVNASFNWGIERGLPSSLKKELAELKDFAKKNESLVAEARSIAKIQNEWSKVTTEMATLATEWKAAEGDAKTALLAQMKEKTALKKGLESELEAAVSGKDKDLELVVSEMVVTEANNPQIAKIDAEIEKLQQTRDKLESERKGPKDQDPIRSKISELTSELKSNRDELSQLKTDRDRADEDEKEMYEDQIDELKSSIETLEANIKKAEDVLKEMGTRNTELYAADEKLYDQISKLRMAKKKLSESSVVYEGAVKQFEMDMTNMIKNIKSGYGWIDPEYVADTWENSSDSIDFELVKGEIYKRLIAAKLLAYADDEDEESAGQYVKSLKELGIKESIVIIESKEAQEAESILNDLLDERGGDMEELHGMSMEDALDTVETYGHSGSKAKKIAQELVSMCNESKVTEAKDDFMARHSGTDIWLKKGYKNHTEAELQELYFKIGELLKDNLDVKQVTVVFEAKVNEAEIKSKSPNDDAEADIDFAGSDLDLKKLSKKYKLEVDEYEPGMVMLKGKKKDILAYLQSPEYDMDSEDIKDLFSELLEAEIKSDDEFKEYAMTILKKAFGADFDEAKAGEVADGILKKCDGDYGACVGMLTSSLGESVVTEGFDANYWEDYHEAAGKIENPSSMQVQQEVSACVKEWNDNNENGKENEVTPNGEKKVLKLAKEFVKAKGWISSDVIEAMIAQES